MLEDNIEGICKIIKIEKFQENILEVIQRFANFEKLIFCCYVKLVKRRRTASAI